MLRLIPYVLLAVVLATEVSRPLVQIITTGGTIAGSSNNSGSALDYVPASKNCSELSAYDRYRQSFAQTS